MSRPVGGLLTDEQIEELKTRLPLNEVAYRVQLSKDAETEAEAKAEAEAAVVEPEKPKGK